MTTRVGNLTIIAVVTLVLLEALLVVSLGHVLGTAEAIRIIIHYHFGLQRLIDHVVVAAADVALE